MHENESESSDHYFPFFLHQHQGSKLRLRFVIGRENGRHPRVRNVSACPVYVCAFI